MASLLVDFAPFVAVFAAVVITASMRDCCSDLQRPRAITHGHVTPEVLSDVMSHDVIRRDVIRRGNSSSSCAVPPSPTKSKLFRVKLRRADFERLEDNRVYV